MEKKALFILLLAILLSVYTHFIVFDNFMMPTFGNTNVHVATARHIVEKGNYPLQDYSYGGTARNLYVPLYRILLAGIVKFTGFSFDFASRFIVLLVSILLPLGFFLLGRKLFGETTGLIAAFIASIPPELLYYTVRPLPEAVGLMLLPFAFYFLLKNSKWSLLFAVVLALLHQETAAFYGLICFFYLIYKFYDKTSYHLAIPLLILTTVALNTLSTYFDDTFGVIVFSLTLLSLQLLLLELFEKPFAKLKIHYLYLKNNLKTLLTKKYVMIICSGILVTITYLAWHYAIVGNLRLWDLAQFKYSEGTIVHFENFMRATGLFLLTFTITGLICILVYKKQVFLWILLLFLSILLLKNDLLGIQAFMDRFIVYVEIFMIPLAAFAIERILSYGKTSSK